MPAYRGRGIGKELTRLMLEELQDYYMIDVCCDADVAPFYGKLGFARVEGMIWRNYEGGYLVQCPKVKQPNIINVDDNLRLRAYDGNYEQAIAWYQDETVYYNSEGITNPVHIPDRAYVRRMYEYLCNHGELYFIEVLRDGKFVPIGDVTLKDENLPIVIGVAEYRGLGIGTKVMKAILQRAKKIGIEKIHGSIIFEHNIASQKLHEALGFRCVEIRGKERIYELKL